jgi:hypothetical protein
VHKLARENAVVISFLVEKLILAEMLDVRCVNSYCGDNSRYNNDDACLLKLGAEFFSIVRSPRTSVLIVCYSLEITSGSRNLVV